MTQSADQWSLLDIERNLDRFESLLGQHRLLLPEKSPLEDLSLAITEMRYVFQGESTHNTNEDARELWRHAVGLADLVKKVLSCEGTPSLKTLVPHLSLFLSDSRNLALTSGPRTHDDTRNKLFELLIGIAAMRDGRDVDIEDPERSAGGTNPDVMATFFGKRWGFACKAPISLSPKTYADHVRTGVKQIDRSAANIGMVVMHQGSLMNHNAIFPAAPDGSNNWIYYPALNEQMAWEALEGEVDRLREDVFVELGGHGGIDALFAGSKAVPIVVNYAAAIAGVTRGTQPVVTILRSLTWWKPSGPVPRDVERVLDCLNRGIHDK